ncbi:MAG: DUF1598 domain-containing protein [Planctomycetes bacterium]|nr:DUF1598 domain-containing protein [Planctomycetota bacterium]
MISVSFPVSGPSMRARCVRLVQCGCLTALLTLHGLVLASAADKPAASGAVAKPDLLDARLAAGEFGPAVDAATAIPDPSERSSYLKQIADAQRDQGELQGAAATAARIPRKEERSRTRGDVVRDRGTLGGGVQADFNSLMQLISTTVQPESWEESSGPGSMMPYRTGVYVDPHGLMRTLTKEDTQGELELLGRRVREADLNSDMARPSSLRLVSLKRLEQTVASRLEAGRPVLETMQHLAGLTQIRYVFVYPDDHDIVIGGPAEGWKFDNAGRAIGRESARPALQLDDLVVILRTFAPGGPGEFGCSINTRDANLKAVRDFVEQSSRTPLAPGKGARDRWLGELQRRLGQQDVVIIGVPANTRVAQIVAEADYRMKLIGVEKLDGGKDIPSYFALLKAAGQTKGAPLEALRWWLTMKYGAIVHNPNRNVFEIQDSSVLVQSENQFVNSRGQHVPTGVSEAVNQLFAQNFTQHYAQLARREPVFAELRNLFDMALVAALCREEHLHDRAGWNLGSFGRDGAYQPAVVPPPTVIESVINHKVYNGTNLVVQVAGGVEGNLLSVARDPKLAREDQRLTQVGERGKLPKLPASRWWWDAREPE